MGKKLLKAALIGSTLGFAIGLMPGCSSTQSTSDNGNSSAQLIGDEVTNMSADEGAVMTNAGTAAKTVEAAVTIDTSVSIDSISWTVHPYSYNGQSWVRTATLTTSRGYVRTRVDTITFYNAAGTVVEFPRLDTFVTLHHVRSVTQSKGDITATLTFNVTDVITRGSTDTTLVKNGTITGTCDGQLLKSGLITGVTRTFNSGAWQFPSSGTISILMPRYTFNLVYTGGGSATATIDNLVTGKTRIVYLTVSDN
jgi:hypothetical protein